LRNLKELGMSVQINMTIARHNAISCECFATGAELGRGRSPHFPAGSCGLRRRHCREQMVPPEEYERMLNWFYDQSLVGGIELKATCAPHYFRVARQRRAADRRAAESLAKITSGRCPGARSNLLPSVRPI